MHTYPNFIKFNNYLDLMDQELSSLTKNSLSSEVVPRTKLLKIDCSSLNNSKGKVATFYVTFHSSVQTVTCLKKCQRFLIIY